MPSTNYYYGAVVYCITSINYRNIHFVASAVALAAQLRTGRKKQKAPKILRSQAKSQQGSGDFLNISRLVRNNPIVTNQHEHATCSFTYRNGIHRCQNGLQTECENDALQNVYRFCIPSLNNVWMLC